MATRQTSESIDETAMEWVVRGDAGPLRPADQATLAGWLDLDARHLGAYARAHALFAQARRARALQSHFDLDALDCRGGRLFRILAARAAPPLPERRALLRIAAGALVTAGGVAAYAWNSPARAHIYRTARGERRSIPLAHAASVTLNTASEIEVLNRAAAVSLMHGEAFFSVGPGRPLAVDAGPARINATRASFSVRRLGDAPVAIVVPSGAIELQRPGGSAIQVGASSCALVPIVGAVEVQKLSAEELALHLCWRQGLITFDDVPLEQAVQEFARYSDVRISVDPSVASQTVTGQFSADRPLAFAQAASEALGLRLEVTSGGVRLQPNA